ncbi:MAG: ribonuclease H [Dehalococcoidia bacterium]|tara:strand:+ start:10492 stop:10875 length:384 start_codon:yes stop_codon:yes gene_type:complete
MIDIYTDGACIGNPGPGGWGVVILQENDNIFLSGGEKNTTNNRMEITAVIEGLKNVDSKDLTVYSDSTYVINTITKGWKKNKNQDLWEILEKLVSEKNVKWEWVKGHSGNEFNEKADKLAYGEAKKQ